MFVERSTGRSFRWLWTGVISLISQFFLTPVKVKVVIPSYVQDFWRIMFCHYNLFYIVWEEVYWETRTFLNSLQTSPVFFLPPWLFSLYSPTTGLLTNLDKWLEILVQSYWQTLSSLPKSKRVLPFNLGIYFDPEIRIRYIRIFFDPYVAPCTPDF